jgi:hypothetical protein
MILIYSEYCQHCNILIETIKKHDKNNIVKKISVDLLRNEGYQIQEIIHSVPALLVKEDINITDKKDILFGKQVFDYLLLPNRGALFTIDNNTRLNKDTKDSKQENININDNNENSDEPIAFSLGSSMSDNFSSLDEESDNLLKDKNYKWDLLENYNNENFDPVSINPISSTSDNSDKKLPSLEELLNKRSKDII